MAKIVFKDSDRHSITSDDVVLEAGWVTARVTGADDREYTRTFPKEDVEEVVSTQEFDVYLPEKTKAGGGEVREL